MTKLCLLLFALLLPACSSISGSDFEQRRKDGNLTSAERYHENILSQLGDAWNERDLERMNTLLEKSLRGAAEEQLWRYERFENLYLDAWVHMVGFEKMGFYVSKEGGKKGAVEKGVAGMDITMTERNRVVLMIYPAPGHSGKILAKGDGGQRSTVFLELYIEDVLVDGSRTQGTSPIQLPLGEDIVFSTEEPYELEIPMIQEPDPDVYIRRVRLRGDLFPATLVYDDKELKTGRFVLQELSFTRYPTGFRKIRAQPVKTLGNALKAPARYRGHILICSHFIHRDGSKQDVEKALDLILGSFPSSPPVAESTILYALQMLVPEGGPKSRDRDGWLRWATTR